MKRIIIFASGSGTNAENIIKFFKKTKTAEITKVLCNNEHAAVFEKCNKLNINCILFKKEDFYDCKNRKNYKNEVQLMIAQMRTLATRELLAMGCDRILSMDSDVLPKYNSIRCMLDMLSFDNGFYDVAQCPYPSQGGGSFLGGGGTKQRQILEDFKEEELKIPKDLMFEYLLSLENFSESHPTLKDITMKEALDAQKQIIDLGFTDQDIIAMKSEELMMEYKLWKQETGQ